MKNRFLVPLVLTFALIAAACGSSVDSAEDIVDDAVEAVEETVDETVEDESDDDEATTTTEAAEEEEAEAPETTTTTEAAEETTTTEAAPETTTTTEAEEEVPAVTIDGQAIYEANCTRCHGAEGQGGRGPSLQGIAAEQPDQSAGIAQVVNGGGGMPAFGNSLSAEEIQATIDYVWDTF